MWSLIKGIAGAFLFLLMIGIITIAFASHNAKDTAGPNVPADTAVAAPPAQPAMTDEQKNLAKKLLDQLQTEGYFGDVNLSGSSVTVIVLPKWYEASFKEKESTGKVALAWGRITDSGANMVFFTNRETNKTVATFTTFNGLTIK